jgi:hypothetical protein
MPPQDNSDPDYDRLPPEVREEFLEKERELEERDARYEAAMRKLRRKVTITGSAAGLILGFLMMFPSIILMLLMWAAGTGTAYLIAKKELDHIVCMIFFSGVSVLISAVGLATGLIVVDSVVPFLRQLGGWGVCTGAGGMLGYWVRTTEIDTSNE